MNPFQDKNKASFLWNSIINNTRIQACRSRFYSYFDYFDSIHSILQYAQIKENLNDTWIEILKDIYNCSQDKHKANSKLWSCWRGWILPSIERGTPWYTVPIKLCNIWFRIPIWNLSQVPFLVMRVKMNGYAMQRCRWRLFMNINLTYS